MSTMTQYLACKGSKRRETITMQSETTLICKAQFTMTISMANPEWLLTMNYNFDGPPRHYASKNAWCRQADVINRIIMAGKTWICLASSTRKTTDQRGTLITIWPLTTVHVFYPLAWPKKIKCFCQNQIWRFPWPIKSPSHRSEGTCTKRMHYCEQQYCCNTENCVWYKDISWPQRYLSTTHKLKHLESMLNYAEESKET